MIESKTEQGRLDIEQEVAIQIAKWNLQEQQIRVTQESRKIAEENYELEKQRYLMGSITLNDLNIAQNAKDSAFNSFYESMRIYWELYYSLRRLTLFDFEKDKLITHTVE